MVRDSVELIVGFVERLARRWPIVFSAFVVGAGLAVAFALIRAPEYRSSATLFFQERIQTSVLQGREAGTQRNIVDRYRELIFARENLGAIIDAAEINPYRELVARRGRGVAIEELRAGVRFEDRGSGAFRISFQHTDKKVAKAVVETLANSLIEKDSLLRKEQAQSTAKFAEGQKDAAEKDLRDRQRALAEFLQAHPEFAAETTGGNNAGAAIRAARRPTGVIDGGGGGRVGAIERQLERLRARRDGTSTAATRAESSAEQVAAEQAQGRAEGDLRARQAELEDAQARFTERHPNVLKARDAVATAQARVTSAKAAVTSAKMLAPPPASAAERTAIEQQISDLEGQLATERARARQVEAAGGTTVATAAATTTPSTEGPTWVVQLETQYSELRRRVDEQQENVEGLAEQLSRAQLFASQQMAENGENITILDPAYEPSAPATKGKRLIVMVGAMGGLLIGLVLALLLSMLDDRIYRRGELEALTLGPLLGTIPQSKRRRGTKPAGGKA
ncbi:MAG: hypothetical protein IPL79_12360 [Myxococcales bacterium]|nr:hypothetical protein [Myxococcales bacterium]